VIVSVNVGACGFGELRDRQWPDGLGVVLDDDER
jgi:hypothetical protein